ncbi:MAG: glycosyltransferase family 4 protein [Thermoplasmata archaeon]|nr:glycosyltransferase family 4 protein [Thermoplasmata archaeon]
MGSTAAGRGRVAVVSHGFFPTVGGSERYHQLTATALTDEADVTVFTADLNLPEPRADAAKRTTLGPLPVAYLPSRWRATERLLRALPLWRALRSFDPDVVWGNHPSPSADLGALYAIVTGRPWVATYHADVSTGSWRNRRYLGWEMWLLRRARAVVVTSDRYRDRLAARGVPADRIVVVPLGPFLGGGVPPPATAVPPPDGGRPFLVVAALDRAHAYKRVDRLLEAVATLARGGTSVRLEVIGDGDRRSELAALATSLGIADRVQFLGTATDAQLAARYANALALVVPSPDETEGFGVVAVEAVQYGCPVIVSTRVAVGDVLGPAAARFDPARPESLAETMRRVVTDPAGRDDLAAKSRAIAPSVRWESLLPRHTAPVRALLRTRSPRRSAAP